MLKNGVHIPVFAILCLMQQFRALMTESTNVTVQVSSKVPNPKAVFYKLCKITYTISFLKIFTLKKCSTF